FGKDTAKPAEPKKPASVASNVPEQSRFINETLAAAWKANKLTPSRRIDDYEFIRRATLDIIGRVAKPAEIEQYFKDPAGTRRAWLIERLLTQKDKEGRIEYARNWSHLWTTWLLTRTGQRIYRDEMQKWLEDQFRQNVTYKELVEKL